MLCSPQIRSGRRGERGYILMTLLLMMALIIIGAAVVVPSITFEIRRDREEEMIHRGVQYSRAIRLYYRKFGRYPMKIEDLENTSQLRFLRKRYKDPITGKDFRLLHYGEAKLSLNGIGGGAIPGASTVGANGSLVSNSSSTFGGNSTFGSNSAFGGNSSFGSNSNSGFGQNSQSANQTAQTAAGQGGPDPSQNGTSTSGTDQATPGNTTGVSADKTAGTFGGAPIVGVASLSKEATIREFDHKKKYNEWQFVYDPTFDQGHLIKTPYQPSIQALGIQGATNLNGTNGSGQNGTNNGFGTGFGNTPSPMQNQPTSPPGGYGNPNPPSSPPQQQ
jgi:type II secretory pathway pseudopilin PulG